MHVAWRCRWCWMPPFLLGWFYIFSGLFRLVQVLMFYQPPTSMQPWSSWSLELCLASSSSEPWSDSLGLWCQFSRLCSLQHLYCARNFAVSSKHSFRHSDQSLSLKENLNSVAFGYFFYHLTTYYILFHWHPVKCSTLLLALII